MRQNNFSQPSLTANILCMVTNLIQQTLIYVKTTFCMYFLYHACCDIIIKSCTCLKKSSNLPFLQEWPAPISRICLRLCALHNDNHLDFLITNENTGQNRLKKQKMTFISCTYRKKMQPADVFCQNLGRIGIPVPYYKSTK